MLDDPDDQDGALLEERADDLEISQLTAFDVRPDLFSEIQTSLVGRGAKLLVGPRGCGKTHQIRLAHRRALDDAKKPLSVYVSFARYLFLEPLLGSSQAAVPSFHAWVLAKIALGLHETCDELAVASPIVDLETALRSLLNTLERGTPGPEHDGTLQALTVQQLSSWLEAALNSSGRKRAVLLLDDAALTLTPQYMVEFFENFRSLKSPKVAPKASVYPGTTMYGPRFHVGHDAAQVNCWISVEDPAYEPFMLALLERRMKDTIDPSLQRVLAYASFGIPRNLIGLARTVGAITGTAQSRFNQAVQERRQQIQAEYLSLGTKLPEYASVITTGWVFFQRSIDLLVNDNRSRSEHQRQLILGIETSSDPIHQRMLRLLREVGLLYELPDVKHGDDRSYWRIIPHLLFLIEQRAFSQDRGFAPNAVAERIARGRSPKHPLRRSFATILGAEHLQGLRLDAPNCQNCKAARLDRDQKFCHRCGEPLITPSVFHTCMNLPLKEVPIPKYQVDSLTAEEVGFRTIGDIVALADPATELQKGRMIGPVRSAQIHARIQSFVAEFLER